MRVGPVAKCYWRHVQPGESAIWLVQHVDAHLFLDDVALVGQIFFVHFKSAHAVGLQPKHAFERIRGHGLVIIRHVIHGRTIQHAAARIDQLDVLHFRRVL